MIDLKQQQTSYIHLALVNNSTHIDLIPTLDPLREFPHRGPQAQQWEQCGANTLPYLRGQHTDRMAPDPCLPFMPHRRIPTGHATTPQWGETAQQAQNTEGWECQHIKKLQLLSLPWPEGKLQAGTVLEGSSRLLPQAFSFASCESESGSHLAPHEQPWDMRHHVVIQKQQALVQRIPQLSNWKSAELWERPPHMPPPR